MPDSAKDSERIARIERMMLMTAMSSAHCMAALSAIAFAVAPLDSRATEQMSKIGDEMVKQYKNMETATARWINEVYPPDETLQ